MTQVFKISAVCCVLCLGCERELFFRCRRVGRLLSLFLLLLCVLWYMGEFFGFSPHYFMEFLIRYVLNV